jgi:hypothetical protein
MTSGFAEAWKDAVKEIATEGQDWEPTEGDYQVRITKARTDVTQGGTQIAKLRLRILTGAHAGDAFDHPLWFSTDFATKMSIIALRSYGLDPGKVKEFDDLDREVRALEGTEADIAVRWDNSHLRVTVNWAGGGAGSPPRGRGAPPPPDGGETGISFADLAKPDIGDASDVPFRAERVTWEELKHEQRH